MKRIKLLTAIATSTIPLSLLATSCSQKKEKEVFRDINLNENWTFRLNDEKQEQNIDLPHDFSIIQDFKHAKRELEDRKSSGTTGFLPGGVGYYHKDFVLPKKDNPTVILNFDGAYNDTLVSINGHIVGNNRYGYNPFAFDISNYVTADGKTENKLDVIVKHEYVTSSRWYPGSGIYRDVKVSVLDKLHVAHNGTYVTTPNLKSEVGKDVTVNVEVDVQNSYSGSKTAYVKNRVVDSNGNAVTDWSSTKKETIEKESTHTFNGSLKVNNPNLWSDKTPNLYYVETQVVSGGNVVDQYKTRFGFRYFEFNKSGFYVNGNLIKLHGVCLHHDQGALGAAAYNDAIYRQLTIMKEMGMNAIRTSHNCPDEDLLRMCDELGLYVMDEAFDGWEFSKTQHDFGEIWKQEIGYGNQLIDATPNMQWHSFVMRSMVKRDRNCPSIFMWSCGNELHEGPWHDKDISDEEKAAIKAEMVGFAQELADIAHELDHDPITKRWCGTALENDPNTAEPEKDQPKIAVAKKLYDNDGVIGLNYGDIEETQHTLENFERVYGSETASARNSRGMYSQLQERDGDDKLLDDGHHHVTSYDGSGTAMASEVIYRTLYFDGYGGQFVWTGFDYIGEPSPWCWNCEEDPVEDITGGEGEPENWPYPNSAYYGIVDTCGFPKDSYYLYRSHLRQDDTTLHLVGSLNAKNMYKYLNDPNIRDGYTPIDIYTNAPYVLIKSGNEAIAKITRGTQKTSKEKGTYFTYTADVLKPSVCQKFDSQIKIQNGHDLYSNILIDSNQLSSIKAEAYSDEECEKPIANTVGLKELSKINSSNKHISYSVDKPTIKADGKSLAYVTVDLLDNNDNLITDYDSQIPIDITWSGNGQVLGVDNGDQETDKKFQSPKIYHKSSKSATIKTYAGKALIIVCSSKEAGEIKLTINGQTQVIKVE